MALAESQAFAKHVTRGCRSVTPRAYAMIHNGRRNTVDELEVTERQQCTSLAQDHDFESATTKYCLKLAADPELKQWITMLQVSSMNDNETRAGLQIDNRKNTIPKNANSRLWYNRRLGETLLSEEERESKQRSNADIRATESNVFFEMLLKTI